MKKTKEESKKPIGASPVVSSTRPRREGYLVDPKTGSITSTRIVIGGVA